MGLPENAMKIKLHIERMVLDGVAVDRTHGGRVRAAVEQELTRLLSAGGVAPELKSGGAVPAVRGGSIQVGKSNRPADLGRHIAGAVYGGIGSRKK
jgi:hypothetical protein